MNSRNILFISYDGMTDPLGQSQVIPYLKGLTQYGYCFTILSCEKPARFALHKEEIKRTLEANSIKWEPISYHKNPPVFSTIYDLIQLKRKARQLHRREKFDMVHTRAGTSSLVGLWMKKKLGVKFLHDVRDFFADSRIDGGSWNYSNPIYRIIYHYFKRIEKKEIEHCDGMVCLTNVAKEIITQLPHYDNNKIVEVIPCS
ncbi:MAG TPA: glycosyltransferase, partial [Chitinophagaceae bacterium]|nr:glycosyltransferase [Chitinophagaceae bacterium]